MENIEIIITTDVNNPLYGPGGAAYIIGPQRGATQDDIVSIDKGLRNFSEKVLKTTNKKIDFLPGSGAAGGIGAGICLF